MSGHVLKKAMAMTTVVIIAIALVTLFILFFLISQQTRFAGQRVQDIQCKKSVRLSAESREAWAAGDVDWADIINCPPHYLTLDTDSKTFNKEFVQEIVNCWDKMGEGKLDLFAQEDAVFCVVCTVFEEFEGDKEISNSEITTYMKNTKMISKEITIWDYLVGKSEDYKIEKIDKSKSHAIVYVHGKTAYEWSFEKAAWEITQQGNVVWPAIKLSVAWIAGWDDAADWDARWAITEHDEESLRQLGCEIIEQ
ncbi:hypothetical protein KY312_00185 [Candidatus Woesearchaeota archaeon]|nr:hypothetical protein [Candidatus Woesearchaeota archaeon]